MNPIDTISPTLGVFIMMNNYFHDVATGMLMVSGIAFWFVMRGFDPKAGREAKEYFIRFYEDMTKLARFSLYWILLGGIPRTLFYRSFEWSNAVGHGQIPAIIVKHVLAFAFVGTGAFMWRRLSRQVKELKKTLKETE